MQTGLNRIWSQATFCTTTRMPRPGSARSRKLYLHNTSAATLGGGGEPRKGSCTSTVPFRQCSGTKLSESGSGSLGGLMLNLPDLYFRLSWPKIISPFGPSWILNCGPNGTESNLNLRPVLWIQLDPDSMGSLDSYPDLQSESGFTWNAGSGSGFNESWSTTMSERLLFAMI